MYGQKETLYDVLGLRRNAKPDEVERAYHRQKSEMQKVTGAGDPRRVALLHEAFEVLSDPQRREAYDASLRSRKFLGLESEMAPRTKWAAIAAAVALAAFALYFLLRSPSGPPDRDPKDILTAASYAVGRLQSLDIGGRAAPSGMVFATGQGSLVTTCHGIRGGTQLLAKIEPRSIPVRVSMADEELDICKLSGEDVGNQPLRLATTDPRAGDKVYAVRADAAGKLELAGGTVKLVSSAPKAGLVEVTFPITPDMSGGPLLDRFGRVVGVLSAPHAYGAANVALPAGWIAEARSRTVGRPQTRK